MCAARLPSYHPRVALPPPLHRRRLMAAIAAPCCFSPSIAFSCNSLASSAVGVCRLARIPLRRHRFSTVGSASGGRRELFGRIAPVYDNLNDILTLRQHRVWKRMCVSWSGAKKGDRVLDLCCGSGDISLLLSQRVGIDGEVIGLDFSKEQLSIASAKQELSWKACYENIKWIEGDALDLRFPDYNFDAITVGYGLRNVLDKPKAMHEILRVLKPGSRVSILDFNKSTSPFVSNFQNWMIDDIVVPAAGVYGLTEEYKYLKTSIDEFLTGKELEALAMDVGFSKARHYEIGWGLMGTLVATR